MAGILDTAYVVAAAAVAVAGVLFVVLRTEGGERRWFDWGAALVAAVFLVAMASQFV
jgi:hypothetical protein